MKLLISIAWRNVWRHRTRSLIVMLALALGLFAGNFMMAYAFGLYEQRLRDALENEISHIQLHHPEFRSELLPELYLKNGARIAAELDLREDVRAASARVVTYGMIQSARGSGAARITGIDPEIEDRLTGRSKHITEGEYFPEKGKNRLLIGKPLADELGLQSGNSLVLTFQNTEEDLTSGRFKICGVFSTGNSAFDKSRVFVRSEDLQNLLLSEEVHEVAILLKEPRNVDAFAGTLRIAHPDAAVETWKEISPELELIIESSDQYFIIFLGIIFLAVAFGVINTMLMAVMERTRELGMLQAVGMNRTNVFFMIVLETVFLMFAAAPVGLFLAWSSIEFAGNTGINLSMFAEGMAQYGMSPIVYPTLTWPYYLQNLVLLIVTALISAIFPARAALKLNPIEAIRKI